MRYDNDWLMAHQPELTPSLENVVDWKQRDAEFARCVKEFAHYLLTRPGRPTYVIPYKILSYLEAKVLYDTYKQYLPLTTQALVEVTETHEAYSIRKIW